MTGTELTVLFAAAMALAALVGWSLRWVYGIAMHPHAPPEPDETELALALRNAEAAATAAQAELEEVERGYRSRVAQAEAEAEAAMDGLRSARQETEYWRQQAGGAA